MLLFFPNENTMNDVIVEAKEIMEDTHRYIGRGLLATPNYQFEGLTTSSIRQVIHRMIPSTDDQQTFVDTVPKQV